MDWLWPLTWELNWRGEDGGGMMWGEEGGWLVKVIGRSQRGGDVCRVAVNTISKFEIPTQHFLNLRSVTNIQPVSKLEGTPN